MILDVYVNWKLNLLLWGPMVFSEHRTDPHGIL